jgi:hypothetical protein
MPLRGLWTGRDAKTPTGAGEGQDTLNICGPRQDDLAAPDALRYTCAHPGPAGFRRAGS